MNLASTLTFTFAVCVKKTVWGAEVTLSAGIAALLYSCKSICNKIERWYIHLPNKGITSVWHSISATMWTDCMVFLISAWLCSLSLGLRLAWTMQGPIKVSSHQVFWLAQAPRSNIELVGAMGVAVFGRRDWGSVQCSPSLFGGCNVTSLTQLKSQFWKE